MSDEDKVAFITAILLSAYVSRGNQPETTKVKEMVKLAKTICEQATL